MRGVRGRARRDPHRSGVHAKSAVPVVAMDFAYVDQLGDQAEGEVSESTPTLVMKGDHSGARFAHAIANKSCSSTTIQLIVDTISGLGHEQVILKSDQEPAIIALGNAVRDVRSRVLQECSPTYQHQANGQAERAVRQCKEMFYTLRSALEYRIGNPPRMIIRCSRG